MRFRSGRAPEDRRQLAAAVVPHGQRLPADLRRAIELLRNSRTHVAALRAAYNGKLTPYVLDDGARPEVKRLARQFGFAYAVRPNRGWDKKSGNLKYGFEISDGVGSLLLAPAEQIRIHTFVSLQKHVGFGLLLAAPIIGVGLARIVGDHFRRAQIGIAVWGAALALGMTQANNLLNA